MNIYTLYTQLESQSLHVHCKVHSQCRKKSCFHITLRILHVNWLHSKITQVRSLLDECKNNLLVFNSAHTCKSMCTVKFKHQVKKKLHSFEWCGEQSISSFNLFLKKKGDKMWILGLVSPCQAAALACAPKGVTGVNVPSFWKTKLKLFPLIYCHYFWFIHTLKLFRHEQYYF